MAQTRIPTVVPTFPACAKPITPSDVASLTDYNGNPRAMTVYVGTGGTVTVVPIGNTPAQAVTFVVPDGGRRLRRAASASPGPPRYRTRSRRLLKVVCSSAGWPQSRICTSSPLTAGSYWAETL